MNFIMDTELFFKDVSIYSDTGNIPSMTFSPMS